MICQHCHAENRPGMQFCESCGAKLDTAEVSCPKCRESNRPGVRFCETCGAEIVKPMPDTVAVDDGRAVEVVCPSCGAANRPAIKFCETCGQPLPSEDVTERKPRPASRWWIPALAGGLGIIILALLLVFWPRDDTLLSEQQAEEVQTDIVEEFYPGFIDEEANQVEYSVQGHRIYDFTYKGPVSQDGFQQTVIISVDATDGTIFVIETD